MHSNELSILFDHALWLSPEASAPFIKARPWLGSPGSMSAQMMQASGHTVEVKVLRQTEAPPTDTECRRLMLNSAEPVNLREVALLCGGVIWMYARSIFPQAQASKKGRAFTALGSQLLATLLFNDPSVKRSTFEIARLSDDPNRELLARRSVFACETSHLLLTEMFLSPCITALDLIPAAPYV